MRAATNKQKYEKIGEKKQSTPIRELCEGFPEEFEIYMNYVRKLGYEETPDYDFLRELFTKVLITLGEPEDGIFDWMLLNGGKGWEAGGSQTNGNTPHREQKKEREPEGHRRGSRQLQDNSTPPTPHVVTPSPAHVKSNNRKHANQERERGAAQRDASIQPLAPTPRRSSQQQMGSPGGLSAPHPYASTPYRTAAGGPYERPSPFLPGSHTAVNGSATGLGHPNGSESFLYGAQAQHGKTSREGTATGGTANKPFAGLGRVRGMMVYDPDQRRQMRREDEDGGHGGRRRGLLNIFCCLA